MMVGVNEGDLSNHLTQSIHRQKQRPGVDPVNGWLVRRPICEGEGARSEGGGARGVKRLRDGGGGGGDTDDAADEGLAPTDTGIIALCGLGTKRNCMVSHGARGGPKAKFDLCDHFASTRRTVQFS